MPLITIEGEVLSLYNRADKNNENNNMMQEYYVKS